MYKKILKFSYLSLLFFAIISFNSIAKAQANGPLFINSLYPGWVVTESNNYIFNYMNNAGYNSVTKNYFQAYETLYQLDSDAIYYVNTHGFAEGDSERGLIANFVNAPSSSSNYSVIAAQNDSSTPIREANCTLNYMYGYNTSALSKVRLAYYSACNSGYSNPKYGCLPQKTTQLGALCSVGFTTSIYQNQSDDFDRHFFSYVSNGYSVQNALNWSVTDAASDNYGDPGNVQNYVVYYRGGTQSSPGGIYMTPAKYGNQ